MGLSLKGPPGVGSGWSGVTGLVQRRPLITSNAGGGLDWDVMLSRAVGILLVLGCS